MPRADHNEKLERFLLLATLGIVIAGLYFAQEILVPIALAILLSFLLTPVVHGLQKLKLPRVAAVVLTVVLAFGLLGGLGYVLYGQLHDLSTHVETYKGNIQAKIDSFRGGNGFFHEVEKAGTEVSKMLASPATQPAVGHPGEPDLRKAPASQPSGEANNAVPVVVTNPSAGAQPSDNQSPWALVESVGSRILSPVGTALLVIILTIFILLQREDLRDRFIRLVGRSQLTVTTQALDEAAERVSRYLLVQSILNGSEGAAVSIALWLIGHFNGKPFPDPALWGLLTALLRFVPYVGIWLSSMLPILLALAAYASVRVSFETAGAYVAIELTLANFIEPFVLGSNTGLAPLAVLVAATFWTWLWGPLGLLMSTPLTVCLVVIGKYVPQLQFLTILLGDEPALNAPARVYQRLLALDQEEAEELVRDYETKMPLEQLYDDVLLPALAMTEWDWHRDQLDSQRHDFIRNGIRDLIEQTAERERARGLVAAAENTVEETRGQPVTRSPADKPPTPKDILPPPLSSPRIKLPKNCVVTIGCLPAHKVDDEIAGLMFARLLELRGYCVVVVSITELASEVLETVEREKVDAVCVSALAPAALVHSRYLCKRLDARFPDLPGVIGLWKSHIDPEKARARIGCATGVGVVTSLADALAAINQLVQPLLVRRAAAADVKSDAPPDPAGPGPSSTPPNAP